MDITEEIKGIIKSCPRGTATELCANSSLHKTELSNWINGRRQLPEGKTLEILSWLISAGIVNFTTNI